MIMLVRTPLRPELQAEIEFGRDNSRVDESELMEFVEAFLRQDETWATSAEPDLRERRRSALRAMPPENEELSRSAVREVQAIEALWSGDYAVASQRMHEAAECVTSRSLRGYRAFLLYLAAAWLGVAADAANDPTLKASARALQKKAHAVGRNTGWMRRIDPLPVEQDFSDDTIEFAARRAVESNVLTCSGSKWAELAEEILGALSQSEARRYERGLVELGKLLGAESYKPSGAGRTDAAWIWGEHLWIAIEAKSEEKPDAPVSLADVRQANDQLKTLAHDRRAVAPEDSIVTLVCPRELVDPTAAIVAEEFLHLCLPDSLLELARDAIAAWGAVRAQASGMSESERAMLVAANFDRFNVSPGAVLQRLTRDPVRG